MLLEGLTDLAFVENPELLRRATGDGAILGTRLACRRETRRGQPEGQSSRSSFNALGPKKFVVGLNILGRDGEQATAPAKK